MKYILFLLTIISLSAFGQVGSDTVFFAKVMKMRAARIDSLRVGAVTGVSLGVDSVWRVSGKDSIFWRRNGSTFRIKDSTGGGVAWGQITGTFENQTDLNDVLATYTTLTQNGLKLNISDTAAMLSPYLRSNVATATYATIAQNNAKPDTTLRPAMYVRYVNADTTTSSTTAVGTGLLFPIEANEQWQVTITGTASKATSSSGMKLAIGAPTGATIKGFQMSGGAALSTAMTNSIINAINTLGSTFATGIGVEVPFRQEFVIINGSTAGNVQLQFATVTSNAATVFRFTKLTAIRNKN